MRILFTCILLLLTEVAFSQQPFEVLIKNESAATVHFWLFRDKADSLSSNQTIQLSNGAWTGDPFYFHVRVPDSKPGEFVLSKFWFFEPDAKRVLTIRPDKSVWLSSSADEVKMQEYLVASSGFDVWPVTRKFIKENSSNKIAAHAIALNLLSSVYDVRTIEQQYRKLTPEAKVGWAGKQIERYLTGRKLLLRGNVIPGFNLPDAAGNAFTLKSMNSKYMLLYFWMPACNEPCASQFQELKELYQKTDRNKLEIVSILQIGAHEEPKNNISAQQLPWVKLFDPGAAYTFGTLSLRSYPTRLLVDASGTIVRVNPNAAEIKAFIARK